MIQIKCTVSKVFLPSTLYVRPFIITYANLILKPPQLGFTQILSGFTSLTEER